MFHLRRRLPRCPSSAGGPVARARPFDAPAGAVRLRRTFIENAGRGGASEARAKDTARRKCRCSPLKRHVQVENKVIVTTQSRGGAPFSKPFHVFTPFTPRAEETCAYPLVCHGLALHKKKLCCFPTAVGHPVHPPSPRNMCLPFVVSWLGMCLPFVVHGLEYCQKLSQASKTVRDHVRSPDLT